LTDKGTPERTLLPSDPWYDLATEHLSERALRRRAKVLPQDSLISTRDLPIFSEYRQAVLDLGAEIRQSSRWFNTLMVYTDSLTHETLKSLPFVDSVSSMGSSKKIEAPFEKRTLPRVVGRSETTAIDFQAGGCITAQYGFADRHNREVRFDAAHSVGIAGEGVLIGILDAGFDWRSHEVLKNAHVVAEYDFVNNDSNTFDEPDQATSEAHGTYVMSLIAGYLPGDFIGGAPRSSFALAKTEDVSSERHIEEDNFVAGLEWLESLGVDVTNTSLGYTTFDPPETSHSLESDLDGKTAFGSRGVNYVTRLGMVCVVSAGNDFTTFRYVGVPGEADSAIAVAALDTAGQIAPFSSRGSSMSTRLKPDIAAPGTIIYGAQSSAPNAIAPSRGTSSAAPIVTSLVALLISSNPDLRPWEVRQILYESSGSAEHPDTAVGYGMVNTDRALSGLSGLRTITGEPKLLTHNGSISVVVWIISDEPDQVNVWNQHITTHSLTVRVTNSRTGISTSSEAPQPELGLARWLIPDGAVELGILPGDSLAVEIVESENSKPVRKTILIATDALVLPVSTLCQDVPIPATSLVTARPNPFYDATRIEFALDREALISLDIFSVLGEHVLTLVRDDMRSPGFYSELLLPNNLPSGAYYYRLRVDDDVFYEKMIRLL